MSTPMHLPRRLLPALLLALVGCAAPPTGLAGPTELPWPSPAEVLDRLTRDLPADTATLRFTGQPLAARLSGVDRACLLPLLDRAGTPGAPFTKLHLGGPGGAPRDLDLREAVMNPAERARWIHALGTVYWPDGTPDFAVSACPAALNGQFG